METCSIGSLPNIEIVTLSSDEGVDDENEKMDEDNVLGENETGSETGLKELGSKKLINEKVESKEVLFVSGDNKKLKTKKLKVRSRGEKRQLPEKVESRKKIKRNKKDEKPLTVVQTQSKDNSLINDNDEIEVLCTVKINKEPDHKTMLNKDESSITVIVEHDSDAENKEVKLKEKSKQMSARKSKAVSNACRETLQVLEGFGSDTLTSMDKSLKILKDHNFLNNKLISMDTLMDLIALAMNSDKAFDVGDAERESNLAKIVSKVTMGVGSTPKTSKAKKSILPSASSPKNKSNPQEDASGSDPNMKKSDEQDVENSRNQDQDSKPVESEVTPSSPEKVQEQAVEKSGKNFCITNYFKKLKKTVEERNKNERFSCFSAKTDMFIAPKLGGELKGTRRQIFEEEFNSQTCEVNYLVERPSKHSNNESINKTSGKVTAQDLSTSTTSPSDRVNMSIDSVSGETNQESIVEEEALVKQHISGVVEGKMDSEKSENSVQPPEKPSSTARKRISLIRVDQPKVTQVQPLPPPRPGRMKAKLFQFHDNRRPPYWGTWRRKSDSVRPRRPFGKDKNFNYEIDSDDEWEEEEEPGESLHGSDDEKEPEEDYEVDNDFFVPHGYLSDDENPEKENLSPKTKLDLLEEQFTSEQKQKTRKMTPLVFGTFWTHKSSPEGSLFQDLQLERLHAFPWSSFPIQIDEEDEKKLNESVNDHGDAATTPNQSKKSRPKTIFPNEEIANLIKMIHGSPQNSDLLAKKFLLQRETELGQDGKRPVGLTKTCVLRKIKELAAWQTSQEKGKMCWLVPKETRQEFGAQVEEKSSEKKPQKCYIWKFMRKTPRNPGSESPSEEQRPQLVELESEADRESTAANTIT